MSAVKRAFTLLIAGLLLAACAGETKPTMQTTTEQPAAKALRVNRRVWHVALECDAVVAIVVEARSSGRVAICSVGANEGLCSDFLASHACLDRVADEFESDAITKVGTRFGGTLGEEMVEPAALCQQDEWLGGRPAEQISGDIDVTFIAPHGTPGLLSVTFGTPNGPVTI